MNPERPFDATDRTPGPEAEVNFEYNDTDLVIGRLRDPKIRQQLIDFFCEAYRARAETGKPVTNVEVDGSGELLRAEDGSLIYKYSEYIPPTPEEVDQNIEEAIREAENGTTIEFTDEQPHAGGDGGTIGLKWCNPLTGSKPNTKQYSIIEAHEKGHGIRRFQHMDTWRYMEDKLRKGFDISTIKLPQEYVDWLSREAADENISLEKKEDVYINEYLFNPDEIAERMSQLKNYFGMSGGEELTKAHLDYARDHYVHDTGFDNGMTLFFQAITPETEDEFLELINSCGI